MVFMPTLLSTFVTMVFAVAMTHAKHYYKDRFPDLKPEDLPMLPSEDFLQHLQHLSGGNYNCGNHNKLSRHFIRNQTVTCNDGSPAGYYLRKSSARNAKWLVFLAGGWFCFDQESCANRWATQNMLMGSYNWHPDRHGTGILSAERRENPYMYNYNTVWIPYCSSDAWSGTRHTRTKNEFAFLGALILEEVIKDLLYAHGLADASNMIMAGSSAGATGVLVNLDRIAGILAQLAPKVEVRGIVDSGWFLDNQQYKSTQCHDILTCSPTDSITKGFKLWQGLVPESCKKHYSESEQWRCYFGYRVYPTLKTPVFVVQHLFDEAQILADNVGTPIHREQWQYIHDIGADMRRTLQNVSAVFAPACLSHILLTRGDWQQVTLRGVNLPNAIRCWEGGLKERNMYTRTPHSKSYTELAVKLITGEYPQSPILQADEPPELPHKKKRHKRKGAKKRKPKTQAQKLRERDRRRKQKKQLRAAKKREKQAQRQKARDIKKSQRQKVEPRKAAGSQKETVATPQQGKPSNKHRTLHLRHKTDSKAQQPVDASESSGFFLKERKVAQRISSALKSSRNTRVNTGSATQVHRYDYIIDSAQAAHLDHHTAQRDFTSQQQQQQSFHSTFYVNPLNPRLEETDVDAVSPVTGGSHRLNNRKQISPAIETVQRNNKKNSRPGKSENHRQERRLKTSNKRPHRTKGGTKRGGGDARSRRSLVFDEHDVHHMQYHENRCSHHLFDSCDWPQCNQHCPKSYNRMSGEQMDFMDMLMQFGLDMSGMAQALNLDLHTMEAMDTKQLFSMLVNL